MDKPKSWTKWNLCPLFSLTYSVNTSLNVTLGHFSCCRTVFRGFSDSSVGSFLAVCCPLVRQGALQGCLTWFILLIRRCREGNHREPAAKCFQTSPEADESAWGGGGAGACFSLSEVLCVLSMYLFFFCLVFLFFPITVAGNGNAQVRHK